MKERSFSDIIRNGLAGLFHIFAKELKATVRDEGVLIFFLLVPLAYPLVYAFIYTNEVVREVPAAVVEIFTVNGCKCRCADPVLLRRHGRS